jgi:hypothetical protein
MKPGRVIIATLLAIFAGATMPWFENLWFNAAAVFVMAAAFGAVISTALLPDAEW